MAKKPSPTKALARVRASLRNQRVQKQELQNKALSKGVMLATSVTTAIVESEVPSELGGVPTKLIGAGLLYLGAAFTKGNVSKLLESGGDALGNIYAFKVAKQVQAQKAEPWVAGEASVDWIVEK